MKMKIDLSTSFTLVYLPTPSSLFNTFNSIMKIKIDLNTSFSLVYLPTFLDPFNNIMKMKIGLSTSFTLVYLSRLPSPFNTFISIMQIKIDLRAFFIFISCHP